MSGEIMQKHFKKSSKDLTPYQQQLVKNIRAVFNSKAQLLARSTNTPSKPVIKRSVIE